MTASNLAVLRYPQARTEYEISAKATPEVGDILTRNGDRWVVQRVAHAKDGSSLVTLGPADEPARLADPASIRV